MSVIIGAGALRPKNEEPPRCICCFSEQNTLLAKKMHDVHSLHSRGSDTCPVRQEETQAIKTQQA